MKKAFRRMLEVVILSEKTRVRLGPRGPRDYPFERFARSPSRPLGMTSSFFLAVHFE